MLNHKIKRIMLFIVYIVASFIILLGCTSKEESREEMKKPQINAVQTDKAMYDPGSAVHLEITVENFEDYAIQNLSLELTSSHLETTVDDDISTTFDLEPNEEKVIQVDWHSPGEDFKGYLLDLELVDQENEVIDTDTKAVDVSSTWTKFPRYGYVWDFTEGVKTTDKIDILKNRNINALEYYDWKYKHHKPIPDDREQESWLDWSGRPIFAESIRNYIQDAQAANMVNLPYNMAYAAVDGYEEDGVEQDWALYYSNDNDSGEGHFKFNMSGSAYLYFFDMSNEDWQNYIFSRTNEVFEMFDFDGWHSDTVGEWGEMQTEDGRTLYVKDTYTDFLNRAKASLPEDKYLVFNPVGAQGIENVNISDVDVLYTEIWPWDRDLDGELYDDYYSLKKVIDLSREQSDGKSLVVPAYMNYDYGELNSGATFNTASVMLTSISAYAAGGSRMELGDGNHMLSNEYFPAQHLSMDEELQNRIEQLYDFVVIYENLLRDGQKNIDNRIDIMDYDNSINGDPDSVWTYAKEDDDYEIVHMINLLGVNNNDWRANEGVKETPTLIDNYQVKYYINEEVESVWLASPDMNQNRSVELSMGTGTDEDGDYVLVEIPSLEYWNMLYMKKK
ncbi:glycoside hydrolase family 66 protein [Gracilibacillus phocaeensis]|uniref:glycoside hydrolase family 66 protein n=1 Tax=Gracilibacillus phocaeensis TaxID=2042304 RepID=UPI0025708259|nr:glycoside hydrolase family 66 protein [Gracilibacillus phocaeensis]